MLPVIAFGLLFFPVLGNVRPDLVSFLPSMRQYAGNWASAVWTFTPGCRREAQAGRHAGRPAPRAARRARHPAGRRPRDDRPVRGLAVDAQPGTRADLGAAQLPRRRPRPARRLGGRDRGEPAARLELRRRPHPRDPLPGGAARVAAASSPASSWWPGSSRSRCTSNYQEWFVFDGALGVVQRGTWKVADCVAEQPWLPNGPIPLDITWSSGTRDLSRRRRQRAQRARRRGCRWPARASP